MDSLDTEFQWLELFTELSRGRQDFVVAPLIVDLLPESQKQECIRLLEEALNKFLKTLSPEDSKSVTEGVWSHESMVDHFEGHYKYLTPERKQSPEGIRLINAIATKRFEKDVTDESSD